MKKTLLFTLALLFAMTTMAQNRTMFLSESFDGTSMPSGWTIADLGQQNWNISSSNHAGGEANELWLYYGPQFNGISRVVMPAVDLTGVESVKFSFKHSLDNYSGSHTLGIATSSDNGATWNTAWSQVYSSDGVWSVLEDISTPDMNHSNVKFCIFYQGNSYNIDNWYFDDIAIFTLENLDLAVSGVLVDDFYSSNNPSSMAAEVTVGMNVFNYGTTPVTSVEATYQVEGNDPVSQTFDVNIASLSSSTLSFDVPTVVNPGGYAVTVTIDKVNGDDDDNLDNNQKSKNFSVALASTDRIPMIEHFSSSTCGPCVSVNNTMNTFCNNNPGRFTYTKYQMNWPGNGDPYYTQEGGVRRTFYGVSAVPDMFLDGTGTNNSAVNQTTFNQHAEQPAYFDVRGSFNVEGDVINVKADIAPFVDMNACIYVSVNEKITHNNVGSNGETSFHHVMMKMLPNASGTATSFVGGNIEHLEFTQNMSSTHVEEMSDLEVSIWVQNNETHYVYNSHFAYEYTDQHPYPVENLSVTGNAGTLTATWEAPAGANPTGYNVYVNNTLVGESITETTFTCAAPRDPYCVMGVTALYGDDQTSVMSVAGLLVPTTDAGLVAPVTNIVLDEENQTAELVLSNGNFISQNAIVINSVEEVNETGDSYLNIIAEGLPFTLEFGDEYIVNIAPILPEGTKSFAETTVEVSSDAGNVVFNIKIDGELLSVTEIPAETKLYPNPTSSSFTVEGVNVAAVQVYNLTGQKVYEENGSKVVRIDAASWNKGVYLVNILGQDGSMETRKLVVK